MASGVSNAFYSVQDRSSTLILASLVTLTVAIILALARVAAALSLRRDAGPEHMLSVAANVLAVVQTAMVVGAVKHGIGRHQDDLTLLEVSSGSKYRYAAQILFILVVAFTKFAMTNFFRRLTQRQTFIRVCNGIHGLIACWTVFSTFAVAMQCGVKEPWLNTSATCTKQDALCVPAVTFASMARIQPDFDADDSTWAIVPFLVYTQLGQNLSLIVTTMPFLHRLGASLHTGRFGNNAMVSEDMRMTRTGYGQTSVDGGSGHIIKLSGMGKGTHERRSTRTPAQAHVRGLRPASNLATISSVAGPSESQENLTGLEGGILQTTRVTVENTARSMDSRFDG
ncbi:hypothetical protein B0A48_05648 [Cryoendolithus antarcticus]|uniref:Rhodopsin domain-containing protein n=1 Tax=Cryoendolithus antarcticus TaxID=1507870 RepID=A0A1V8TJK4_9PEZI|nr:hypothetical protein B0A48_05648 [Cryoendolithus antarcticus]